MAVKKRRSMYVLIVLGMLLMFTGCFGGKDKGSEEVKVENEYSVILDKIVKDVDLYSSVEKRADEATFIGEGIYINVLAEDKLAGYEGWYYYSLEAITKLEIGKINELLLLLAVCGPKERVYCVFGDKAIGIFNYKSIEDTKTNGEEAPIGGGDKVNKIDNIGITSTSAISTGTITNTKAYVIDYPTLTTGGIVIKYEREIPVDSVVEFVSGTELISSTSISVIETGTAKVDVDLTGSNYKIRSKDIYFGKYGEIKIENIIIGEMIFVPAGTTSAENGNITVSQSFYIGKYEVTQSQWETVMTGNSNGISATPSEFGGNPNNPVEQVSWYDVLVYCNRLSVQEGLIPVYSIGGSTNPDDWGNLPEWTQMETWDNATVNTSANGYRLPTEAEWEYAARGGANGNATTYAGSDNIEDVAWYWQNSGDVYLEGEWDWDKITENNCKTHIVGTKQANELGIYDMSGNVWEWCYDWYPGYDGSYRVLRGGSWYSGDNRCGVSNRSYNHPYYRGSSYGFRPVRTY